jgi:hypothetical protein
MDRVKEKASHQHPTVEELEYRAQALQAVGWLLLVFDAIVAVFIFIGIRDGSWLWLYWTLIEGAFGLGFLAAGIRTEQLVVAAMGHTGAHLHAGGEVEHREAA